MKTENEMWDVIKEFYLNRLGIPNAVIEKVSNLEFVRLCSTGCSIASISKILNTDIKDVSKILTEVLEFPGWEKDLDISPLFLYNKHRKFEDFESNVKIVSVLMSDEEIKISYRICKIFEELKKEIDSYYDSNVA